MNIILQNYKSRETLLQLLKKAGYDTEEHEGFSKNEVDTMTRNNTLDILLTTKKIADEPVYKAYVKYLNVPLTVALVNNMIEDLYETADDKYCLSNDDLFIVVVLDEPNEKMLAYMTTLFEKRGLFMVVFNIRRLQFNVLNHELQPREITILKPDEWLELKRKLNIQSTKELPEISRFDPLAMAVFLRPGQVCRLVRDSPTSVSAVYYRACV